MAINGFSCAQGAFRVLRASWRHSAIDFSWPKILPSSARVVRYGYDEVNLNCGCPSSRVAGKGHTWLKIYLALHFAWHTNYGL